MPLYTWIIAEHSWRHTFYFSFSLTLLPIVLIYFFTSNFPQENKYVNVLELQKINKSTTEEVLHKNSSEKISVVERAKVYLCNSNFWILLAVFSSNSMLSWGVVTWLPTYLNTERGFSWANVGWMSALPFIFGLLFKVLAGFIVDKTDRKGMVMFVSAMLCAASILTGVNISNNFFRCNRYLLRYRRLLNATTLCVYPLAINGSCRSDVVCSGGFKWYGRWFRGIITCINWFYIECYS